jgi:hypothetical protein
MEVDFVALRRLVVDDSGDILDIETTRSNIGGKQVRRFS